MNGTAVSRRPSRCENTEGPNVETKEGTKLLWKQKIAEKRKAKTEESGESSVPLLKSAIADKAERNNSFLPSNKEMGYIPMMSMLKG